MLLKNYQLTPDEQAQVNDIIEFIKNIPNKLVHFVVNAIIAVVLLFIGFKIANFLCKIIRKAMEKKHIDEAVISFVDTSVRIVLKALLIFMAALIVGVQAASVATLLGSCAIAISLAVQGSLSNFAGGILILLLKPFIVGDYIVDTASEKEGIVRSITIFYTKIQDIYGNIIVLPNGTLANTTMVNKTNGSKTRDIKAEFSIAYSEDIDTARKVVKKALRNKSKFLNEDSKVFVSVLKLDDSGIVLEAKASVDKEKYFEARTEALEIIKYALDEAKISIPFPQLDVHFDKVKDKE